MYASHWPVPIDDREIWACANHVLRQYGADAWLHAAQRADALLADGDDDGHHTWLAILRRINDLDAMTPIGKVH